MALCSECTYLGNCYDDGTFWCEARLECVYAHQQECYRFCRAYNRPRSVSESYEKYSKQKESSSSGCYITTIVCNILRAQDNNPFLNTLREFRGNILQKDEKYKPLLAEYDIVGPIIASNLMNDPLRYQIAANLFFKYIKPVTKFIRTNENEKAIETYIEMTNNLKEFYSIDITISKMDIDNIDILEAGHGFYKSKKITI